MTYGIRIGERDLVPHALRLLDQPAHRAAGLTMGELDRLLREVVHPTGENLAWLEGRFDDRFSQKVRNLRCHRTLERAGLAVFQGDGRGGRFMITEAGRYYLRGPLAHFQGGEQLQLELR